MNGKIDQDLFMFKQAPGITRKERFLLLILVLSGILSIFIFFDWWFKEVHVSNLLLYVTLTLIFWYSIFRLVLIWINYLGIRKPEKTRAKKGLSVAIYTTSSPGEPLEMFDKTLEACQKINYPHTTYLLDDTQKPEFKALAEKHGAVWLNIVGFPGAKAGKINEALKRTHEDFILVMDPDHIPFPDFFEHTLGYFEDEKVGFVQVSQAYYNQYRSFTAKGAAEQTYTFYGPTQMGLNGYGCSVAIGANCTFRRKALESIGGHGIGLAEDLITSIRLHAAGWKSIYNPVVVSRGLVPEDFGSFCKQQLKWARGVFEVTFVEIPNLFKKLSVWQKISYTTIGTYYLTGIITFFFTLIPFLFFLTGTLPAHMDFSDFLIKGTPIVFFAIAIYIYVQKWMCDPETERGLHWRGMILKHACWPVFSMGFLLSLVNAKIPYIPTAKKAVRGYFTPFARPLLLHAIIFIFSLIGVLIYRKYYIPVSIIPFTGEKVWGMLAFALVTFVINCGGILAALEANRLTEEDPWENVNVTAINKKQHESHII
jgi:cellulose synthase (UDP-forming)